MLLVEELDRDALVAEAARFKGAQLVHADLDELTLDRIRDALESPAEPERDVRSSDPTQLPTADAADTQDAAVGAARFL